MRQAVADAFVEFTRPFEGMVLFMYADCLGLVTTGLGSLIDPVSTAVCLPWKHKDTGVFATEAEIVNAWEIVKGRSDLKLRGGMAYRGLTDLVLDQTAVDAMVQVRLRLNDSILGHRFAGFDDWPSDAQLGLHSMSWAMGASFKFPRFQAAVSADPPDFFGASVECKMSNGAPSRNHANQTLFINAGQVLDQGLDPETLYYPITLQPQPTQAAQPVVPKDPPDDAA